MSNLHVHAWMVLRPMLFIKMFDVGLLDFFYHFFCLASSKINSISIIDCADQVHKRIFTSKHLMMMFTFYLIYKACFYNYNNNPPTIFNTNFFGNTHNNNNSSSSDNKIIMRKKDPGKF